jgi:hypothetical protein
VWTDDEPDQGPLHASFALARDGEQIGLYDPAGTPVSTFSFGPQETDVSYGRLQDGGENLGTLPVPTPGAPNAGGTGAETPAAPAPAVALQAYPSPFRGQATVRFDLPQPGEVVLDLYDVAGRRVRRLAAAPYPAGTHHLAWDGTGETGRPLTAGLYFVRLLLRPGSSAPPRSFSAPLRLLP